jgi:hypothetical protein
MDSYFFLSLVKSPKKQAVCACSYLGGHVKDRVQTMVVSGKFSEIVEDWEQLKAWLMDNYAPVDPEGEANVKMKALYQR